jgi:hypothetical protein
MTLQVQRTSTSAEVRARIIDALRLDLVGPRPGDARHAQYQCEILPHAPSQWYLTGFLAPIDAPDHDRHDDDAGESLDQPGEERQADDDAAPEAEAAKKAFFPSSMGLSVLIPAHVKQLRAKVRWGDYIRADETDADGNLLKSEWQRTPREQLLDLDLSKPKQPVPESSGLELEIAVRAVEVETLVPSGTRSLSVFLVNRRRPAPDGRRDEGFAFQPRLELIASEPFVPRPDPRGQSINDWDEKVADLQYRDTVGYVVGHNVSAEATVDAGLCRAVRTSWMPQADVEKVVPNESIPGVELGLEALAGAKDAQAAPSRSRTVIGSRLRRQTRPTTRSAPRSPRICSVPRAGRAGALTTGWPPSTIRTSSRPSASANRAVARAIRQRLCHGTDQTPEKVRPPRWRPFQLAFLLTNLILDNASTHRSEETKAFFEANPLLVPVYHTFLLAQPDRDLVLSAESSGSQECLLQEP